MMDMEITKVESTGTGWLVKWGQGTKDDVGISNLGNGMNGDNLNQYEQLKKRSILATMMFLSFFVC